MNSDQLIEKLKKYIKLYGAKNVDIVKKLRFSRPLEQKKPDLYFKFKQNKLTDLKSFCKELKLDNYSTLPKEDIIHKLIKIKNIESKYNDKFGNKKILIERGISDIISPLLKKEKIEKKKVKENKIKKSYRKTPRRIKSKK